MMEQNNSLCSISWNQMTSKGINLLLSILSKQCSDLARVSIGANKLSDEIIPFVCDLLDSNPNITDFAAGGSYSTTDTLLTDKSIQELSQVLIGNVSLRVLDISYNKGITEASVPLLKDIATQSGIKSISLYGLNIPFQKVSEIHDLLKIPRDERQIPIFSNSKSAAKSSAFSSST